MPDNVLNAMRGLTEYLMKENQLAEQKRKEEKINLASERIAEAYKKLPPNASIQDIQSLGFRAIEDASALGTVQEVLPLINQMQQSTIAGYQIRKGEASSNAIRETISNATGEKYDPRLSGQDVVSLETLTKTLNPPQVIKSKEGITSLRKYGLGGKMKSEEVIDAFGVEEQKGLFAYQENIKFEHEKTLANIRGSWSVRTSSAGNPGGTGSIGLTPKWGWESENGQQIYTDNKGDGAYIISPEGKPVFFQGKPKKVDIETQKERALTNSAIGQSFIPSKSAAYNELYLTGVGPSLIQSLTRQSEIPTVSDNKNLPDLSNINILGNALNSGDWEKNVDRVIKGILNDPDNADLDLTGITSSPQWSDNTVNNQIKMKANKDRLWTLVKNVKRLDYAERQAKGEIAPAPGSNQDVNTITKEMNLNTWNKGQGTIQQIFNDPAQEHIKEILQGWLGKQLGQPSSSITYDVYTSLDSTKQAQIIKLIQQASGK